MQAAAGDLPEALVSGLADALGPGGVLTDGHSRELYAQDIYFRGAAAAAVLRPESTDALRRAVALCTAAGVAVIPRGGGMSYTAGYLPPAAGAAIVDLGRMDRVLAIDPEDMTVTVEAGCTWAQLHGALADSGLRTPYWGTLSGLRATVGGSLSQNAVFWGSGQFGASADSLLSLDVVLADGSLLRTGSAAHREGRPFFRHYGPDLTGLFTGDSGALGFKATATLRLIPDLPAKGFLAYGFATAEGALGAMSDLARHGLPMECFGFDPSLQRQRMKGRSLAADAKALAGVMKAAGSLTGALRDGARLARAGRGYLDEVDHTVQIILEDRVPAAVDARAALARELCLARGGRELEDAIPRVTRANPFGPMTAMLGPRGERWLPVHGLFPHSRIREAHAAVEALFTEHRERCDQLGVVTGYLFATVSTHAMVLEPVFFWPDERYPIHDASIEDRHLARLPAHPPNPEARALVAELRTALLDLFRDLGAAHLQIGRSYRFREGLRPEPWRLLEALKRELDPHGLVNPGALGLGG